MKFWRYCIDKTYPLSPILVLPMRLRGLLTSYEISSNIAQVCFFTNPVKKAGGRNLERDSTKRLLVGGYYLGEMPPDSCRVMKGGTYSYVPHFSTSGSRTLREASATGGVESPCCSIPLAPCSPLPCLFFKDIKNGKLP